MFLVRPGRSAALAEERRLLIAGDARERNVFQALRRAHFAVDFAGRTHSRHHRERDSKQVEEFVIPGAGVNVEEHGARGVAGVGGVNAAAGQLPEQPGVDGAEGEFAGFGEGRAPGTLSRIQEILLAEK